MTTLFRLLVLLAILGCLAWQFIEDGCGAVKPAALTEAESAVSK